MSATVSLQGPSALTLSQERQDNVCLVYVKPQACADLVVVGFTNGDL